jgi:hypothetical protein
MDQLILIILELDLFLLFEFVILHRKINYQNKYIPKYSIYPNNSDNMEYWYRWLNAIAQK